jgi:hypothetical protein
MSLKKGVGIPDRIPPRAFSIIKTLSTEIVKGAIFKYTGSSARIRGEYGLVVVHSIDPEIKNSKGTFRLNSVAVVESLPLDHCNFWVEKTLLVLPTQDELDMILELVAPSNAALEAIARNKENK